MLLRLPRTELRGRIELATGMESEPSRSCLRLDHHPGNPVLEATSDEEFL